jgi:hypothetical protein
MAKGDITDRIKKGIQPGLKPMGGSRGLSVGPSFDELKGNPMKSNEGKHPIGANAKVTARYNAGVPNNG